MYSVRRSYVLSHLQGVAVSTTTINIQNTQAEVDYVHVGLSVGGGGGEGASHFYRQQNGIIQSCHLYGS